jgi:DNA-binding NarL/FixJ family response regulator
MTVRLLVVDGQEIIHAGLEAMLADKDVRIIARAATAAEALELALEQKPDLILLELQIGDADGLQVLGRLKLDHPELHVLIFSTNENPRSIARAVALGAEGFLRKDCTQEELYEAIKQAAAGKSTWSRAELRRVGAAMATPAASDKLDVALTQREMDVLEQMVTGATNRDIAKELNISYETVKEHVQHVLQKLNVTDRTQAAVWAVRNGLF